MAKIKICGLTRTKDIMAVNEASPDYIGFVFAKSKRQVNYDTAKELKSYLDPKIKSVGVFVNEDIDNIATLCNEKIIDLVQLHGDETKEYIERLKMKISCQIIKAVRVKESQDIFKIHQMPCDYILLDAYHEDQYGGNGISFDWSLISIRNKPFFLAGGIHYGNIQKAIKETNPYCIDISSGVETDGLKDPEKIKEIVDLVRISAY
ncbi:phosphoribosylanthranilate isomerase [Mobilisporobacter senegalensis]|uniref:N-(5'-phosphoribosyl)anthranilate isomerase n=1 Tax=Mobilisporobacter senegalensis TaxID=1329262 RepID=A0A3N1XZZ1_9FIRM|nr:phosphoribosylanthranilate isomerase [Mobilisporobacter senegalensis]ROR31848.1 phosphoribosylanthranilate isomerase [Mobilisporobacter senegalensis]